MRKGIVLVLTGTILFAAASPAAAWRPRRAAAVEYAHSRAGRISFAVMRDDGRMFKYRAKRGFYSASVIKAMFLVAYLRQASVRDRALSDDEKGLLGPMIRRSDNYSASVIADRLGAARMERFARAVGMRRFAYTRPWGLSRIDAAEQARFFHRIDRFVPKRHRSYAMWLLSHIVPSQRWGIPKAKPDGWRLFFKGGWGSGTGWVCHQVALLRDAGRRVSVAILIKESPSHEYATQTLRGMARRLLRGL